MNDDNKILNQNVPPIVSDNQGQPQAQVQPVVPVGSVNKEVGPVTSSASEFVKSSEAEPQIERDIAELGVEAKKDEPKVTNEHVGIVEHAKQFTPIATSPTGKVTLPMSEDEILQKLKTGQNDDSSKWLAWLMKKIIAWGFKSQ